MKLTIWIVLCAVLIAWFFFPSRSGRFIAQVDMACGRYDILDTGNGAWYPEFARLLRERYQIHFHAIGELGSGTRDFVEGFINETDDGINKKFGRDAIDKCAADAQEAFEEARKTARDEPILPSMKPLDHAAPVDPQKVSFGRLLLKQTSPANQVLAKAKTVVDFQKLRKDIATATSQAFTALRAEHPHEDFYALVLYSVDDAVIINLSVNSEQAYRIAAEKKAKDEKYAEERQWLASHGISLQTSLLGDQRWSAYEWKYECTHTEYFDPVHEQINNNGIGTYDEADPLGYVKFKSSVFATMVLALEDLKGQGLFNQKEGQRPMTLFCSIPNSEGTAWLEMDSARRLNSPDIFQEFFEQRIKWITKEPIVASSEPDDVYALYLDFLKKNGSTGSHVKK